MRTFIAALLMALMLAAPALAFDSESGDSTQLVSDAIKRLAINRNLEALRKFQKKDYPAALALFREAYRLDPDNPEVVNNLAYLCQLLGNNDEAEEYYRRAISLDAERYVAFLNLADLLGRAGESAQRLDEAARLLIRARELRGAQPELILKQARIATRAGRHEDAERFYREYRADNEPDDAVAVEIGDFYRDLGRSDTALEWYRRVSESGDQSAEAAKRIWELEVEKQARRFGWTRVGGDIGPQARSYAAKGRIALGAGQYAEAERLFQDAIATAPQFASAHADLGDAVAAQGRDRDAESAYLRAIAHESGNAEYHARLAEFYLERTAQGRAAEAVLFFERALALKPDWSRLHWRLALAYRAAGNLGAALTHVRSYLPIAPDDPDRTAASELEMQLVAAMPPDAGSPEGPVAAPVGDDRLVSTLGRVQAHLARGELDAAMAVLAQLPESERTSEVLNIEAGILAGAGRLDDADKVLAASIAADPAQPDALTRHGLVLLDLGRRREAISRLRAARELGDLDASYHLAKLRLATSDTIWPAGLVDLFRIAALVESRKNLEVFVAQSHGSAYLTNARSLIAATQNRVRAASAWLAGFFAVIVIGAVGAATRIYGGRTLADLVREHPESGPEIQRVLAAIRHEVLKHNTMALAGLADAVSSGDDASDKAAHLVENLFGRGGDDTGVVGRFQAYVAQMEQLGRAHRTRLNLDRRDGAIAPLRRGFAILKRSAADLRRVDRLSASSRRRLERRLRSAAKRLHTEGYEAVRELLDHLRVLSLDESVLRSLFDRVRREPAFREVSVAPLDLRFRAQTPCAILMPRAAFDDVMGNLIRNALAGSAANRTRAVAVAIDVDTEIDDITGLERLVIAVFDRAPGTFDSAALRDSPIEHGLGIALDTVSRFEGSIEVRPGRDGWTKAVAVRLPRAESAAPDEGDSDWS